MGDICSVAVMYRPSSLSLGRGSEQSGSRRWLSLASSRSVQIAISSANTVLIAEMFGQNERTRLIAVVERIVISFAEQDHSSN
jgi:hypothetical protein